MEDDPSYEIAMAGLSGTVPGCEFRLRQAIETALRRHRTPSARISVALVDDAQIAEMNRLHLQRDGPTDVLAFDLSDAAAEAGGSGACIDGAIVVSSETAGREARARGHGTEAELALYTVHGLLHLLGYDDHSEEDAARMHAVEDEILTAVGYGAVFYGACGPAPKDKGAVGQTDQPLRWDSLSSAMRGHCG